MAFDEGLQVLLFLAMVADSDYVSAETLRQIMATPMRKFSRAQLEGMPEYLSARALFEAGKAMRDNVVAAEVN